MSPRAERNRAVMPVVGIALVVAIVVILAVVISIPIFEIGESVSETGPTAVFSTHYDEATGNVTITHESGQPIETANLSVTGAANWSASSEILRAGETLHVAPAPGAKAVVVAWEGEETSAILAVVAVG